MSRWRKGRARVLFGTSTRPVGWRLLTTLALLGILLQIVLVGVALKRGLADGEDNPFGPPTVPQMLYDVPPEVPEALPPIHPKGRPAPWRSRTPSADEEPTAGAVR